MRKFAAVVLVACTVGQPLPACINDSATQADEQQFASGYGDGRSTKRAVPARTHPGMLLLVLPGLTLLGVGLFWLRQERMMIAKRQQRMFRSADSADSADSAAK